MKYWVVLWIEYKLPGGLFGKFIPKHLQPFLGEARPQMKHFATKSLAYKHVRNLGQLTQPRLYWYDGFKGYERDIDYVINVKIQGEN